MDILSGATLASLRSQNLRKSYESEEIPVSEQTKGATFSIIASLLFNAQNFLEFCHHNVKSEPKHRALGEAYEDFSELKDTIIEQITGVLGTTYGQLSLESFADFADIMCEIAANNILAVSKEIQTWANLRDIPSVENLAQELFAVGAKLKYKVTFEVLKSQYTDWSSDELEIEKAQLEIDLKFSNSIESNDKLTKSLEAIEELLESSKLEKAKDSGEIDPKKIAQMVLDGADKKSKKDTSKKSTEESEKVEESEDSEEETEDKKDKEPFNEDGKTYDQTIQPGHELTASDGTVGKVVEHDGTNASIEYAKNGNVENTVVPAQTLEKLKAEGKLQHNAKPKTMKDHHKQQLEEKYTSGEGDAQSFLGAAKSMGVDEDEALEHYTSLKKKWPKKKEEDDSKKKLNKSITDDLIKSNESQIDELEKANIPHHHFLSKYWQNGRWNYDYGQHFNGSQRAEEYGHSEQENNYQQHLATKVLDGISEIQGLMSEHDKHEATVSQAHHIEYNPNVSDSVKNDHQRRAKYAKNRLVEIRHQVADTHDTLIHELKQYPVPELDMEKSGETKPDPLSAESLLKGGEGSRGGKVIGHTQSGKPIYEPSEHNHSDKESLTPFTRRDRYNKEVYKDFTPQDHADAAKVHSSHLERIRNERRDHLAKKTGLELKKPTSRKEELDGWGYENSGIHKDDVEKIGEKLGKKQRYEGQDSHSSSMNAIQDEFMNHYGTHHVYKGTDNSHIEYRNHTDDKKWHENQAKKKILKSEEVDLLKSNLSQSEELLDLVK